MMKYSIAGIFLALMLSNLFMMNAQSRVPVVKNEYTFVSGNVANFKKWDKNNTTGEWYSTSPGRYKGPKSDQYDGAFYWNIVSFKDGDKNVYAIRFRVGSYFYRYSSLELDPIYSTDYIYYFITYHDVLKLQNCHLDEVISIKPYGCYMYDKGADGIIRMYAARAYEDNCSEKLLIKRTMQGKQEVVRFVLPYEGAASHDVFHTGPYYELTYKNYRTFINTLAELSNDNENYIPIRSPELLTKLKTVVAENDDKSAKFDTTSYYLNIYNICNNPHYYDGQRIRFVPAKPTSADEPFAQYLEGFTTDEPILLTEHSDTLIIESKKGSRSLHIFTPQTNIYHPVYVNDDYVRNFNTSFGVTNNLKKTSGFYTPLSEIIDHTFTIASAYGVKKYENYYLILKLKDENDDILYFSFTFYAYADKEGYMPILMLETVNNVIKEYVGKSFLMNDRHYKTSYAAIPEGGNSYIVPEGKLKYIGTKYMPTRNHHDYVSMGAHKYSYGQYYLEPHIQFTDSIGNIFSLLLPKYDSKKSTRIVSSVSNPSFNYTYYELTLDDLIESNEYYLEKKKKETSEIEQENIRRKEKEDRLKTLISKYGKGTAEDIINGYVRIGWNTEKCVESWGQPDDINKSIGIWGVHEQWVYEPDTYLYFEDGILTAIQN